MKKLPKTIQAIKDFLNGRHPSELVGKDKERFIRLAAIDFSKRFGDTIKKLAKE